MSIQHIKFLDCEPSIETNEDPVKNSESVELIKVLLKGLVRLTVILYLKSQEKSFTKILGRWWFECLNLEFENFNFFWRIRIHRRMNQWSQKSMVNIFHHNLNIWFGQKLKLYRRESTNFTKRILRFGSCISDSCKQSRRNQSVSEMYQRKIFGFKY